MVTTLVQANFETKDGGDDGHPIPTPLEIHSFHPCQHQKYTVTTYHATIYMEVV